jgi:hypothetical protein
MCRPNPKSCLGLKQPDSAVVSKYSTRRVGSVRANRSQGLIRCSHGGRTTAHSEVILAQGKARSSANAIRHGLLARQIVLPIEGHAQYLELLAALKYERALTMRAPLSHEEERWVTLGLDALARVLVVV